MKDDADAFRSLADLFTGDVRDDLRRIADIIENVPPEEYEAEVKLRLRLGLPPR